MDIKKVLVGAVAATVVGVASASVESIDTKQEKEQTMKEVMGHLIPVISVPECTYQPSGSQDESVK